MSRTSALGHLASFVLPLGLLCMALALASDPGARAWLARHEAALDGNLRYLQARTPARRLLRYQAAAMLALGVLALASARVWLLLLVVLIVPAPRLFLRRRCDDRSARIEEQLDTLLLALANALKANPSLGEALASTARLLPAPLGQEISLVLKQHALGNPIDRCLTELGERVGSTVVSTAVATIRIARNAGGNLGETLESCAASLREMARLEGVVRTKTAEGRAQSALIGAVPFPLLWLLHALDPHLLDPLWDTMRGHVVVAVAAALWGTALLSARKILAVDL
ncbi:MAG: type II secretion system F family protein [Polyangiales bacterium]